MGTTLTFLAIVGCASAHLTTAHEPVGGYKENNECLGAKLEIQADDSFMRYGGGGFVYRDSFDKHGTAAQLTAVGVFYEKKDFNVGAGASLGWTRNSYWNNFAGMPILEFQKSRARATIGYLPKFDKTEELFMAQGSILVDDWTPWSK